MFPDVTNISANGKYSEENEVTFAQHSVSISPVRPTHEQMFIINNI